MKKVQGIGWYLEEENMAQVSTNLLDFETTPLHTVYEEICRDARVGGLVLVPKGASQRMSPTKFSSPPSRQALLSLMLSSAKVLNSTEPPETWQLAVSPAPLLKALL